MGVTITSGQTRLYPPAGAVAIDESHFPDSSFREYIAEDVDPNRDGWLTRKELSAVTSLDISEPSISDLKGIEYFTSLETLDCSSTGLTSLDVSKCTLLKSLKCSECNLTALNVGKCTRLEYLYCVENPLTTLDVSGCTGLKKLICCYTKIATFDLSKLPPALYGIAKGAGWYDDGYEVEYSSGDYTLSFPAGITLYDGGTLVPIDDYDEEDW
ncbi:MAG: hypothetical protein IJH38_00445 [Clostridia bacterium]|nr:hypothetical protein [Clostridia bacterium]